MNPLRLRQLDLALPDRHLLQGLSLDLHGGLCTLLTGANGAGKSTLLRIVAGLTPADRLVLPDLGCNSPRRAARRLRRLVTYIHQQPFVFRGRVRDNLMLALPWSLGRRARQRRVDAALEWAELDALRDHEAGSLSGGERQRLSLARAWLRGTPYLLLDEPTANLDTASRERLRTLLQLLLDKGHGMMIATHDPAHFRFVGGAHWHLAEGRLRLAPPSGKDDEPQGACA
ncbi:MAG: ATP-binding cassette domain-containing protein [Gammaproteobacteria bacterium]|nr:MAG: ATP-binding cassette domain-containing protein [Gammaproteobacteria bacterium]